MVGQMTALLEAGALTGAELLEVSKLSADVTITGITLSVDASDNSINDSAAGLLAAGFEAGDRVNVVGFTTAANNIFVGTVASATAGKVVIATPEGDDLVTEAAGDSVTIAKWVSRRTTPQDVAELLGGGGGAIDVEDSGTPVVTGASAINFTGAGVTVTDAGDGVAEVDIPGGGGGGGGGAMELIAQWSHTTDVANVTFTDLGGYTELLLIVRNVTLSAGGIRSASLSVDNGTTFFTAPAAYQEIPGGGVETGSTPQLHTTANAGARSGVARLIGNVAGSPKLYEFRGNRSIFVGSNDVVNAIRVYDGNASANLTGGQIFLYGRP